MTITAKAVKASRITLFLILAGLLICAAAIRTDGEAVGRPMEVFAGIPPVAYIVDRVGGAHVNVNVLMDRGQDPHTFEPSPRQVVGLSRSKMYFKVGLPFENRLIERVAEGIAGFKVVDIGEGVTRVPVEERGGHGHSHGDGHDHGEDDLDPHIWLSPGLLKIQAANIRDALINADSANAAEYHASYERFIGEVEEVDRRLKEMLEPFEGRAFFVFHPAFGYFADAYGLRQVAVETDGRSPTPRTLSRLIAMAREEQAEVIFVQPQFDPKSAEAVASAIGARVETLNVLSYDLLATLVDMGARISNALEGGDDSGGGP